MGHLRTEHVLAWQMHLAEGGYTCFELRDPIGRRWGWIVNAPESAWMAHVGDWGQAQDLGQDSPPLDQDIKTIDDIEAAKAWVEETIALQWRSASSTV